MLLIRILRYIIWEQLYKISQQYWIVIKVFQNRKLEEKKKRHVQLFIVTKFSLLPLNLSFPFSNNSDKFNLVSLFFRPDSKTPMPHIFLTKLLICRTMLGAKMEPRAQNLWPSCHGQGCLIYYNPAPRWASPSLVKPHAACLPALPVKRWMAASVKPSGGLHGLELCRLIRL